MPPAISTLPLSRAVTVAPRSAAKVVVFNDDQNPGATLTVAEGAAAAAVPAPLKTISVYVAVGTVGATWTPTPLLRPPYTEPSLPTMLAVPGTAGDDPKSKTGVSVVEPPWWMTPELAVRLTALAGG